jgi:transcriptional regulator with XRE-family HTH domain
MDKLEILKRAIRDHIENEIGGTLTDKERALKINKGDLSRIMKMKVLPSVERIFQIEKTLKVNILLINPPHSNRSKKEDPANASRSYKKIQEHFLDNFDNLIDAVTDEFKDLWVPPKNKYDLQVRKTMNYISVNLVPKKKDIGGFPLLTFRFDDRKLHLGIWFIAPDEFLQKRIVYTNYNIKPTGAKTTYHPGKRAGNTPKEYLMPGQPVMFVEVIDEDVTQKVCTLSRHVYEIQEGL